MKSTHIHIKEIKEKHYIGHRSRLRDRFNKFGPEALQEYELVELLLTYVLPQRDVKPIAKELLKRFGSLKGIFEAEEEELKSIPFIKEKFTTLLKLIKEINVLYRKQSTLETSAAQSIEEIAKYCNEKFRDKKEEEFHVIYLDSALKMITDKHFPLKEFYIRGTIDKTVVYPRVIIEEGLKKKAYGMIIVHNHPNGKLDSSDYDKNLTKAIDLAAKSVGMVLFDHLIVNSSNYLSFKKEKLL
ncbi:MAG: DNA repair protein RadC [Caldisericia bacterium]|nr:DNA repair protein RadC [Caldisericia bacterium]